MKVAFVGGSSEVRSKNADAQRALNVYLEMDNASPRAPVALYGRPGMVEKFQVLAPMRAMLAAGDFVFIVASSGVYRTTGTAGVYSTTFLGSITSTSGPCGLAYNGTEVLIVDGAGGWLTSGTAAGLTTITDADFPNGVTRATYQDGYFLVAGDGSQKFYISDLADGSTWDGLDFASAEASPDLTIGIISDHQEIWLFGSSSVEIYINTGNPDFPFERVGNAYIQHGCAAGDTVARLDNTIAWLGEDAEGGAVVWKAQGYTPVRISTHALEKAMQGYSVISDARAFSFQMEGHAFYVLTFPTADATWAYDASTGQWFEWSWRDPLTNVNHRWRASCHAYFQGDHLVGDFENNKVYSLDLDTYTDNGDPMLRLRATQCMESEQGSLFFDMLQVDMETGVGLTTGQGSDPQLMLRHSDNGGHTWSNIRTASIGAVGEYGERAIFRRLGKGRNRVFEISMTDPVKFAVFGANAKVRKGTS